METSIYDLRLKLSFANLSQPENINDDGYPTKEGMVIYSIITPIICGFGIFGNLLSLIVLNRQELKGSIYVYLAAFVDLAGSVLLFLSGLSFGILFMDIRWPTYDILYGLPLSIIVNTMGVFTTVMITFDRICYLSKPMRRKKPKCCHTYVARLIMFCCFIISVVSASPYFFIFTSTEYGEVIPRPLYFSRYYSLYNWLRFIIIGILPSVYLILGNGYLVYCLHKIKKVYDQCSNSVKCKIPKNYTSLTTTLILIIFVFTLSQIPAMLVSRSSTSTFFFSLDNSDVKYNSKSLETIRQISTLLSAISLSSDFVLYYLFCPAFCKILGKVLERKKKRKPLQMNVFVIDQKMCFNNNDKSMEELTPEKIFRMMDDESCRDSLASTIYDGRCEKPEEVKSNRDTLITLCSEATG